MVAEIVTGWRPIPKRSCGDPHRVELQHHIMETAPGSAIPETGECARWLVENVITKSNKQHKRSTHRHSFLCFETCFVLSC